MRFGRFLCGLPLLALAMVTVACAATAGGTEPNPQSASTMNLSSAEQQFLDSDGTQALLAQSREAVITLSLEQQPPGAPRVRYENGQLTIESENSRLSDILIIIGKLTGAGLEMPPELAKERVAIRLGPGKASEVLANLLYGSKFGWLVVEAPDDSNSLQRIVITNPSVKAADSKKATTVVGASTTRNIGTYAVELLGEPNAMPSAAPSESAAIPSVVGSSLTTAAALQPKPPDAPPGGVVKARPMLSRTPGLGRSRARTRTRSGGGAEGGAAFESSVPDVQLESAADVPLPE
jgi:hypothetical protein